MAKQKMTAKQRDERLKGAQERERRAEEKAAAAQRTKKIFTVVVCVILVLALALPTMGLALFGASA
ncbi:MAG: CASC3 protein CASC3 [Eggerthellales bacterium]|nr:CASC3 protein CASC3 [Eggerthellales bacterium]